MKFTILYIIVNMLTFVVFGVDKAKAEMDAWRIPEKSLLILCAIGGSLGGYLGMRVFHHKTRKALFKYGVPALFIIQMSVLTFMVTR